MKHSRFIPICLLDTGETFETMTDAARRIGVDPKVFYKRWQRSLGEPNEFEAFGHHWSTDSERAIRGRPVFNLTRKIEYPSLKAAAKHSGESPSDISDALFTGCLLHGEQWSRRPWGMNEKEKRILCPIHKR